MSEAAADKIRTVFDGTPEEIAKVILARLQYDSPGVAEARK
jgi:hypothetical protein